MRIAVISAILLMCLIAMLSVINDKSTNAGLPLVQTALPEADANRLFSPCPLTPKNIPPRQEATA